MIVGYHVIFSAYGLWLPNDPRGSWSDVVGSWELFRYGSATKTNERRSLAYRDHDRARRNAAKSTLNYPPVQWQEPGGRLPKCWVRGQWKVYLDADDVARAIQYVEENPLKERKPRQEWSFVEAPPGWALA